MIETLKTATIDSPDALSGIPLLVVIGAPALGMVSSSATPAPVYVLDDYLLDTNNDD